MAFRFKVKSALVPTSKSLSTSGHSKKDDSNDGERLAQPQTYQLEPSMKCKLSRLRSATQQILQQHLSNCTKTSNPGNQNNAKVAVDISNDLREELKGLLPERYRVVVKVYIFSTDSVSCEVGSRCIWNVDSDVFIQEVCESTDVRVCACVYGIYKD